MTARLVSSIPELAVTTVAGFSLGPMVLLLAGHFSPWPVFVTGIAGAVLAGLLCGVNRTPIEPDRPDRDRYAPWTLAAVALVIVWVALNVGHTAENVYATRDPATYNITARWLMDNPSLHIHTHPEIFGSPPDSISQSPGFSYDDDAGQLYSQGNHLMPALAAVVGWVSGIQGMFRADLIFGALALLALFGLARRVVGSPLALLATAAMALSLPMLYVSRDMYSEPLMMLFLMGSLELLYRAIKYGRRADFALAGFVGGCSALVRIDSYASLLAIIVSVLVVVALAAPPDRRRSAVNGIVLVAAGAVPALVGWLDVTRLSYGYYRDQHHHIVMELLATLGLLVVGPFVIALVWRPAVRSRLVAVQERVGAVLGALLVATFVMLASRPLWFKGRWTFDHTLETWQRLDGAAVDGTRSYSEQTVFWLGQFLGWPTLVLAVAGYVLLIQALVRRRAYPLVGVLSVGLTMSGLYLWNPQITPDLPWAMRRFVPVVLPLMLVAAAVAMRALVGRGRWGRPVVALLGVLVLAFPLWATWPMRGVRENVPQYSQVQAICRAVGRDGAVVMVDTEALGVYGQTMRSYCHVPSIGLLSVIPSDLLTMKAAVAAHHRTLYVMSRDIEGVPFVDPAHVAPFSTVRAELWPNVINRVPRSAVHRVTPIYLGTVGPDGRVQPLPAP